MVHSQGALGSSQEDLDGGLLPSDRGTGTNNRMTSASTLQMLKNSLTEAVLNQEEADRASLLNTFINTLVDVTLNL